jgi:hypothetical protein
MKNIITTLVTVLVFSTLIGCAGSKLEMYRGYYFDAKINSVSVVEIKDKSSIAALKGYERDVRWKLDRPINGNMQSLHIVVGDNKHSKEFVGRVLEREAIEISPLQYVEVETEAGLSSDSSVRVNGGASLAKVNILTSKYLPVGNYVFRLKVHGTENWDRKDIYVEVR